MLELFTRQFVIFLMLSPSPSVATHVTVRFSELVFKPDDELKTTFDTTGGRAKTGHADKSRAKTIAETNQTPGACNPCLAIYFTTNYITAVKNTLPYH
ncbi:hypothetical protein BMS3Abin16_00930 [archaeon BMS3Abin16]|nr:hypothetical protein BMS3Abin16_00930 [archaeon BMS3Abin16]